MVAVDQKLVFLAKKIASLAGNTWEALQCVRWHQNAPEGVSCTFKVLSLVRAKMINIMQLYVGPYGGN